VPCTELDEAKGSPLSTPPKQFAFKFPPDMNTFAWNDMPLAQLPEIVTEEPDKKPLHNPFMQFPETDVLGKKAFPEHATWVAGSATPLSSPRLG
jgi:hypothetical protein